MLRPRFRLAEWFRRGKGQGLVEYALIVALVALLATGALVAVGDSVVVLWQTASTQIDIAIATIGR
jgi:Flp pilus assembly pilin Flp